MSYPTLPTGRVINAQGDNNLVPVTVIVKGKSRQGELRGQSGNAYVWMVGTGNAQRAAADLLKTYCGQSAIGYTSPLPDGYLAIRSAMTRLKRVNRSEGVPPSDGAGPAAPLRCCGARVSCLPRHVELLGGKKGSQAVPAGPFPTPPAPALAAPVARTSTPAMPP